MGTRLAWIIALAFAAAAAPSAGCSGPAAPDPGDEELASSDALVGSPRGLFYTARRDVRKCPSPSCGGYFLKRVNAQLAEEYVSRLEFPFGAFDERTIDHIVSAGDGEVVFRGTIGREEPTAHTRALVVREAFRGMPGVLPRTSDLYYRVEDRDPPIACFVAPCNNELAYTLNTATVTDFTALSVGRAEAPHVDTNWLVQRILHHGAIVTGSFVPGERFPGGYESRLMVSQVYIRLPDEPGPSCPDPRVVCPGTLVPGFDRDENRCLQFAGCVDPDACTLPRRTPCAPGYTLTQWASAGPVCYEYACDPSFVVE